MTLDQFWYYEPRLLDVYVKKRELELDNINFEAWLIGLYNHYGVTIALANAFSDKGSKKSTYFEKPLEMFDSKNRAANNSKKENKDDNYRQQYNYWAKLGKKGV